MLREMIHFLVHAERHEDISRSGSLGLAGALTVLQLADVAIHS